MSQLYKHQLMHFLKIYSIYTFQSGFYKYKTFCFSLKELYDFLYFKNKNINEIQKNKKQNKIFLLISFRLSKILFLNYSLDFFIKYLKFYYKIYFKILVEHLYLLNSVIFHNFHSKIFFSSFSSTISKNLEIKKYHSQPFVFCFFNIWSYNILNYNEFFVFFGHHYINLITLNFNLICPITFFYEMDTFQYNIFGILIVGKFLFSPNLRIYENNDILDFLFKSKNLKKNYKKIQNYFGFFNKKLFSFFLFYNEFLKKNIFFEFISLNFYQLYEFKQIISIFYCNFFHSLNINNLEFIKTTSFFNSINLSLSQFNLFIFYKYLF